MPLNPPNSEKLQSFYVSPTTIFKFSIDTSSILIGADGVTRYIVVITIQVATNKRNMKEFVVIPTSGVSMDPMSLEHGDPIL